MVNGVPYPRDVQDRESFSEWLNTIDRPTAHSTSAFVRYVSGGEVVQTPHKQWYMGSIFEEANSDSKDVAVKLITRAMANCLFQDLIMSPASTLVWRIEPEFDIQHLTVPATNPIPKNDQNDGLPEGWAEDFVTNQIFKVAAPIGIWRIFKGYVRYSVVSGPILKEEMPIYG
jgi:hypothetical protein